MDFFFSFDCNDAKASLHGPSSVADKFLENEESSKELSEQLNS
jgi:hypothetical protein